VDANENAAQAKALYENPGKDKVLVFDTPFAPGPQKPRVFADGLAIPLGVLPYKDGCYVQHGPDIVLLHDTDNDGRADKREVILTGFGVQDSHLFPASIHAAPAAGSGWRKARSTTAKCDSPRIRLEKACSSTRRAWRNSDRWFAVHHYEQRPVQHLGPCSERRRRSLHPGG
jgi:hypothetical protein